MSTKKERRAQRHGQRRIEEAAKTQRAMIEAGIPEHRLFPAAPARIDSERLHYQGRPCFVVDWMLPDEPPIGYHRPLALAGINTPYRAREERGEEPELWAVSKKFYDTARKARIRAVTPSEERGGIDQARIEVTGLGRGATPRFTRAPNKALTYYLRRGRLEQHHYEVGMQLFLDYEESQIPPGSISDPSRIVVIGGKPQDWIPVTLDAERRVKTALGMIGGTGRQMVFDVCCLGHVLRERDYEHYSDRDGKMSRLKEALDELKRFYAKEIKT